MAWLFGQVWVLCLAAFVVGSAVTWIAFVVPARRAARRTPTVGHGWHPAPTPPGGTTAVGGSARRAAPPDRPIADLDSALAAIDSWKGPPRAADDVGAAAVGALDDLGVGRPEEPGGAGAVPRQSGPRDEPE